MQGGHFSLKIGVTEAVNMELRSEKNKRESAFESNLAARQAVSLDTYLIGRRNAHLQDFWEPNSKINSIVTL